MPIVLDSEYMTEPDRPETLRSLNGIDDAPAPLETSTLVVIDAQMEYGPDGQLPLAGLDSALTSIETLLDRARSAGAPVIHVRHLGQSGGLFAPELGGRIFDQTQPLAGEAVVEKTLPNGFAGTGLHELLTAGGTQDLIIAGFMTHMCVSSTARAARDLGYRSTVVSDATATRALVAVDGGLLSAEAVHSAALAALADLFSSVVTTKTVVAA